METLLTAIGTVISIIVIQLLRDWRDGKNILKRNGSYEAQATLKKVLESQNLLSEHFNHETTTKFDDVITGQAKIVEKLDKILIDGVRLKKD